MDELLAPTPTGKEPKIILLAKNVTWFAVIVLVLIEIFVSIKTGNIIININSIIIIAIITIILGGAPFKFGDDPNTETVIERPMMPSLSDLSPYDK